MRFVGNSSMRHFAVVACLFLVLSVSVIARAENDYDNIWFEERDTNTTTSDTTTGSMTTGSTTTGGSSTQVYDVTLGDQNVTVSIPVSGNHSLKIQFPAIGNFSAKYSSAGSDIADYADPDSTKPSGATFKGASFFITLFYPNGSQVEGFTFPEPIIVTIGVDGVSDDDALYLYDTNSETWTDAAATCANPSTQVVDGNLVVAICHLTQFAVFEMTTTAQLAKSHNTSGLIAAVIIIPIVIVGVIIALVAWTLLRKPHKRSRSERDLEMEKTEKSSSKRELTKEIESDSDTDSDSEEVKPKQKPEEKKPEAVVELKKSTSNSDDSDTDTSSDSSEHLEVKKKAEEKKKRESSDTDTDTDTDSDE